MMNDDPGLVFVVSDREGRIAAGALTQCVAGLLADFGYSVAINDPYKGGTLTERTAWPAANRHSLQIEINRALYLDEATFQKSTQFDKVRSDLGQFIERLGASLDHALRVAEEGTVLGA